tara:strand:+ start:66 stop:740 length:675 start_codon:yes stop_codon:yes gene_type:complete
MKINQTKIWHSQSLRYVKTHLNNSRFNDYDCFKIFKKKKIKSTLDIGCGNGLMLDDILNNYCRNSKKNIGVEASKKSIQLLRKKTFNKKINFKYCYAHNLPFDDEEFDLVYIWSVLHWIDRRHYLQSLGESLRVTKKYLVVMDWVEKIDFKVPYKHKKGFFTYKMDFDKVLSNSGILKKIYEERWFVDNNKKKVIKNNNNKKLNQNLRKVIIYKKKDILKTIKF